MVSAISKGIEPALDKVAQSVARRYARLCWWASRDDLLQEARLAIIVAKKTYDPDRGTPITAYVRRAAVLALSNALWRDSSPVSGDVYRPKGLRDKRRVELTQEVEETLLDPPTYRLDLKVETPTDELLDEAKWRMAVRARVEDILKDDRQTMELAFDVLLNEEPARDVATDKEVDVRKVYLATQRARHRIAGDLPLIRMMRDRTTDQ